MKTKQLIKIKMILLAILFGYETLNAQANEKLIKLQPIGFGLHIEQFKWSDMEMGVVPANKIVVTVNTSQNFRIEPEIGYNSMKDKNSDLSDKSIHLGCSLFLMGQRNNTNIYGGLKFGNTTHKDETEDWQGEKKDKTLKIFSIGPAIGCEYLFGAHFSLGGDISLKYTSCKEQDTDPEDEGQHYLSTDTGLILRFYF